MLIAGTATLAFSPDLKWFQGSIVNETKRHMVYSITGRLRRDSNTANEEQEQAEQRRQQEEARLEAGLEVDLEARPGAWPEQGPGARVFSEPSRG